MKIFLTGASGMVGTNLYKKLITIPEIKVFAPTLDDLNLLNKEDVGDYIKNVAPDLIIHLAAKVGGIQANIERPVEFLFENTIISANVIMAALENNVPYLINMGSSCMYPKGREILREEDLLTGRLEPTNEGYAISKISAALLCSYVNTQYHFCYKTIIPCNLYGQYDNFHPEYSHLIPSIIRKIHFAKINKDKKIIIWGDGLARREFMYVDDLVDFILLSLQKLDIMPNFINVGLGYDHTVNEYYQIAAKVMGYEYDFFNDVSKPVGMRKKLLDVSKAHALGWKAKTSLFDGLKKTYEYFLSLQ